MIACSMTNPGMGDRGWGIGGRGWGIGGEG